MEEQTINLPSNSQNETLLKIWGNSQLQGHVTISGAKNSALAIMAATLLSADECRLGNVPALVDINHMGNVLSSLGIKLHRNQDCLEINTKHITTSKPPYELVSRLRASFFVIGPLLSRLGAARVPLPGGCAIGARPVDLHVNGLEAMGAQVRIEHGIVHADIPGSRNRLQGADIYLDYPSVGATETILMAATLAEGETRIENAAREPEVVDLANFCNAMGANIYGAGTNTITISGVKSLHGVDYSIIPDRIEAGTFLVAGAITQSELSLSPVIPEHLTPVLAKLRAMGLKIVNDEPNCLRVIPGPLQATDIETLPYPGFPTDMQAQFMALLSISQGDSVITETVFENRLRHVAEFKRMGADIRLKGQQAIIRGVSMLTGAPVVATDLRASSALVLAGLAAKGITTIQGLHHLDRGYDNLEQKLQQLGAQLERVDVNYEELPLEISMGVH